MFDIYKLDPHGSAMWMGSVQTYSVGIVAIELIATKAPGDYAIVNRETGERNALSFGVSLDDHVKPIEPEKSRVAGH